MEAPKGEEAVKSIRILQIAVVAMFVLMVVAGMAVFLFAPEKLTAYNQLIQTLFPIFLAQVIPALIGSPLTDAVRNLTARKLEGDDGR